MGLKGMNRREFIGKTALGLCATGLGTPILRAEDSSKARPARIVYRTLGRTGLKIPIVSFGVMNSDSPDLLKKALDIGIEHFDTAHVYLRGNSEKVIGGVLEETGKRNEVYISTKMRFARDREKNVFVTDPSDWEPGASAENLREQLNASLQRLRTDYVDILYLHSCYSAQMATYEPLMKAMVKTKEAGKTRFIGISTHSSEPEVIRAAVDTGVYDVVLTAYNFMQDHKEKVKEAIGYAAGKGVGVVAMKTQGGVRLNDEEKVEVNHSAALKWVLNDKNVCTTIPGITTFDQMDTDFSVMEDLTLTDEEKRDLKLSSMLPGRFYCQSCRSCVDSCPSRVEIPNLMRAYMYAEGYGNPMQARRTVVELPENLGLNVCRSCTSCSASCRCGINIGHRLKTLLALDLYTA
jgi:predicted aldo/keto reductase-like oxidoreductase